MTVSITLDNGQEIRISSASQANKIRIQLLEDGKVISQCEESSYEFRRGCNLICNQSETR